MEAMGVSHHALGKLQMKQLGQGCNLEGDQAWAPWELEVEEGAWGVAFSSNSSELDGVDEVQQLAGIILLHGWASSSSFLFSFFFFLSFLLLSPFFLSFLSSLLLNVNVRMREMERVERLVEGVDICELCE